MPVLTLSVEETQSLCALLRQEASRAEAEGDIGPAQRLRELARRTEASLVPPTPKGPPCRCDQGPYCVPHEVIV